MGCVTCGCKSAEGSKNGICDKCGELFVDDKIWYVDENNELQKIRYKSIRKQ